MTTEGKDTTGDDKVKEIVEQQLIEKFKLVKLLGLIGNSSGFKPSDIGHFTIIEVTDYDALTEIAYPSLQFNINIRREGINHMGGDGRDALHDLLPEAISEPDDLADDLNNLT